MAVSLYLDAAPEGKVTFGRVFPPDAEWLGKQEPEEIMDPDRSIVDAHHHLWNLPNNTYLLEDFRSDLMSGHRVVATVFVECLTHYRPDGPDELKSLGETEFATKLGEACDELAPAGPRIAAAIVGYADLRLGGRARPILEAHIEAAQGRFRGVRHPAGWDGDPVIGNSHQSVPHLLSQPNFREGLAALQSLGLSFDAWVFFHQLRDVIDVATQFPELNIIMGHAGGPLGYGPYAGRRDEVFSSWKKYMTELAARPNVSVKLGGQMMRLAAYDYQTSAVPPSSLDLARYWGPWFETCIELFGADRCMFESNFPVDKMGTGYAVIWNAFKRIASGASEQEKDMLFSGTARRAYRMA